MNFCCVAVSAIGQAVHQGIFVLVAVPMYLLTMFFFVFVAVPTVGQVVDHGPREADHQRGGHGRRLLQGGPAPLLRCVW